MTHHEHGYTISALEKRIGMSRKTVWAWVRDGKLKSSRYGTRHREVEFRSGTDAVFCAAFRDTERPATRFTGVGAEEAPRLLSIPVTDIAGNRYRKLQRCRIKEDCYEHRS